MSQANRPLRPLWDWAVDVYGRPGMKDALLSLQNAHDADVPLVLWRLWLHEAKLAPTTDGLAHAIALSDTWRACVVSPLRDARNALKTTAVPGIDEDSAAVLRTDILAAELAAEKLQLEALQHLPTHADARADALGALVALPSLDSAPEGELSLLINALDLR